MTMSADVGEEQLWSWVDRDSPELERFLAEHPERRAEVEAMQGNIRGLGELSRPAEAPVPDQIGPYRVIRLIGSGGMGLVYEAEQPAPQRRVAIKVIRGSALADERMVRLFQREAQALAPSCAHCATTRAGCSSSTRSTPASVARAAGSPASTRA